MPFPFSNMNFLLLWLGQIFSQSGTRLYQVAIVWWILSQIQTQKGLGVAVFMILAALPAILLVKKIGFTVEKSFAKKILVTADLTAFFVMVMLFLAVHQSQLEVWHVYIAGVFLATCQAFIDPTLNKAIPELVEAKNLESAISLQSSTQSLANFGGAVAGAFLIDLLGVEGVIEFTAGCYLFSALANIIIRYTRRNLPDSETTKWEQVSGFQLLKEMPFIRKLLFGFGYVNFFATPTLVTLPIYVNTALDGNASLLGFLESCLWGGLLFGTFAARFVSKPQNPVVLAGVSLLFFGTSILLPGLIVAIPLYATCLAIAGCALGINNVKMISYFQRVVKPEHKGRFFSVLQALIGFSFPVAYFVFGLLNDALGAPHTSIFQGVGICLLSFYFFRLSTSAPSAGEEQSQPTA